MDAAGSPSVFGDAATVLARCHQLNECRILGQSVKCPLGHLATLGIAKMHAINEMRCVTRNLVLAFNNSAACSRATSP
jgi:hypothetical protein